MSQFSGNGLLDYMSQEGPSDYVTSPQADAAKSASGGFVTPEEQQAKAKALAHLYAMFPELSDLQHRMAMAQALSEKQPARHTTGPGGAFEALAQGIKAFKAGSLEKEYGQQLAKNRPAYEQAFKDDPRMRRLFGGPYGQAPQTDEDSNPQAY